MTKKATIQLRPRVGELLQQMPGMRLYREAKQQGYATLTAFLEAEDPSEAEDRRLGLDAFGRMLMLADIKTASHRLGAYYADTLEKFGESDLGRALFPEWGRRIWAGARAQAQFLSGDFAVGTIQRPYDEDTTLRIIEVEPAIPLDQVVARTRLNEGGDYRARYLTQPAAADVRMRRVAEAAELPRWKLTEGARTIRLPKFGGGLEASYEALRRMRLDDFAVHIRQVSLQNEVDQVVAALDVMINGDGNSGTAGTVYALTTLDPATTADNLTITAWLSFLAKWTNPYQMTGVIGREGPVIKMQLLTVGTANVLAAQAVVPTTLRQDFVPMNNRTAQGIRFGISADAPADKLVGFDARVAVEHVVERGSDINESERWITRQTEVLTFSLNEAFAVLNTAAVKILNLAA